MADKAGAIVQEAPDADDLEAGRDFAGGPDAGDTVTSADGVQVRRPADAARLAEEQTAGRPDGGEADTSRSTADGSPTGADRSNLIFGKYRTQEEAEAGYRELERTRGADAEKAARLEKLLEGAISTAMTRGEAPGGTARRTVDAPKFDMVNWIARASLGEDGVNPGEFIDHLADALLSHPRILEGMVTRIRAERELTAEQETLRSSFFDQHKHLRNAPEWFLKNVASQVEQEYERDPALKSRPRGELATMLIEETGKRATEMLSKMGARFDEDPNPPPAATRRPEPRRAPTGVFGERGGGSAAGKPKLTGQEAELASVFGE